MVKTSLTSHRGQRWISLVLYDLENVEPLFEISRYNTLAAIGIPAWHLCCLRRNLVKTNIAILPLPRLREFWIGVRLTAIEKLPG